MDTTNNNGDDPFFLWRARATLLAPKMKLDAYLINEAIGIINTVLGESWLQAEGLRKDLGTVVPFRAHPIGNCLQAVWEPQVAELVELAEYLKFAARSQSFSKVAGCLSSSFALLESRESEQRRGQRAGGPSHELVLRPWGREAGAAAER